MTDQDLPLEPEPTPEERAHFEQLSAALDGWAADTSVRLPDPTSAPATTSPPAGAPVTTGDGPDVLGWIRRPQFAAAILAASVVAFCHCATALSACALGSA